MNRKVSLIYCIFNSASLNYLKRTGAYIPRFPRDDNLYPPIGLLYLASVLKKENFDVSLIDISFLKDSVEEAAYAIGKDRPVVAGIYVSSFGLYLAKKLISGIRALSPQTRIVVGGPHVHSEPTCIKYLNADFGMVSDGEFAFPELVKALINKSPVGEIPNVVRTDNSGVHINPIEVINDLDSIPFPARELWPHKIFSPRLSGKITTMLSSRGCRFNCSFCASVYRGTYRARSVENIIDELKLLEEQGFRHVDFVDDNMSLDMARMEDLCKEIIRRRLKIRWECMSRIDCVEKALLGLMKRANCTQIKYGIESGSERVRNILMGKNIEDSRIKQVIRETKKAGILSLGFFLLGMPGESYEEANKTLQFAREIGSDYVEFRYVTLLPGSALSREAIQQGKIPSDIWERLTGGEKQAYDILDNFVPAEVKEMRALAMRRHYFNIRFLMKEAFLRSGNPRVLFNKLKILTNNKYNTYLNAKSFYDVSGLAYLLNFCKLALDRLSKSALNILNR